MKTALTPFKPLISRRHALKLMGGAVTALAGWSHSAALLQAPASAATMPRCTVRPEQTEGPFYVDERLHRSDIRIDASDHSTKPGMPLRLGFQVSRVSGTACTPLNGAVVDVWHCDARGVYSDVREAGFDTRGKTFLRGYQLTNANGVAAFLTIYPGWYAGRAVHVHFKIRAGSSYPSAYEFTSQLYFDESITEGVHRQAPYNHKGPGRMSNNSDFGFRRGGEQLMPLLSTDAQGYAAFFGIGLRIP